MDVQEIIFLMQGDDFLKQALYELLYDTDEIVAFQAAWVLSHLSAKEGYWLRDKQNQLIDEVLACAHSGKKRILLQILTRQPGNFPLRLDFFDFCLNGMCSKGETPAVQAACMKLAFELSRQIPELLVELQSTLEIMEPDFLTPATRATRKNVLKKIKM